MKAKIHYAHDAFDKMCDAVFYFFFSVYSFLFSHLLQPENVDGRRVKSIKHFKYAWLLIYAND